MTHVEDRTQKKHAAKPRLPGDPGAKAPTATTVVFVPLTGVHADFDFNSRSKANVVSESDSGPGGSLEDLSPSLRMKGQDHPVTLRPNTHEKGRVRVRDEKTGHLAWWWPPYELVDGFRRFVSIGALNLDEKLLAHSAETGVPIVPNVPNGHIAAEVRPLDDHEAELLNIRAGVTQNNLEPPDLMAALVKLSRPPKGMTAEEVAESLGMGLVTVKRYVTVGHALLPAILAHWRVGGELDGVVANRRLSFDELAEVAKEDKDKQLEAYKAALSGRADKEKNWQWFNAAEKSAVRMGCLLARLEVEGVIRLTDKPWEECIPFLVKLPMAMREKTRVKQRVANALQRGYDDEKRRDATRKEAEADEGS